MNAPNLQNRLKTIREAKFKADQIIEALSPGHMAAEAAIAIAWELLFDYFCNLNQMPDVDEMNKLTAIIHKLMTSNAQIKTLEHKIEDQQQKIEEREKIKEELKQKLTKTHQQGGLSQDMIRLIERQLELM